MNYFVRSVNSIDLMFVFYLTQYYSTNYIEMKKLLPFCSLLLLPFVTITAQDDTELSNIQEFTPSKLLKKGQWDIKSFWGVYTQTKQTDAGSRKVDILRQTFLTNTNEIYTGVSNNSRINLGLIFQIRSNQNGGNNFYDALGVFRFKNDQRTTRSGLATIAPSIRVQPFRSIANFSLTSSLFIPVFEETPTFTGNTLGNGDPERTPFLDQRSFAWETKFFYDKTFGANKWQLFTQVDFKYNFGESSPEASENENADERFAGESVFLPLSAFLSYFPSSKSTVFVNVQQTFLISIDNPRFEGDEEGFSQNATAWGFGFKYQLTPVLNVETSFSDIFRGENFQGVGETYSIGLRALF